MLWMVVAFGAPQAGDLVFHESRSQQAAWLKAVTKSRYTHVGMVIEQHGQLAVIEAVQPVQVVPLDQWIARGVDKHVAIRRPREKLDAKQLEALRAAAVRHLGKDYDLAFSWDDERIYCTELVAKAYQDALGWTIGNRQPIGSWQVNDPRIESAMSKRGMDPAELALAPVDLLNDPRWFVATD